MKKKNDLDDYLVVVGPSIYVLIKFFLKNVWYQVIIIGISAVKRPLLDIGLWWTDLQLSQ